MWSRHTERGNGDLAASAMVIWPEWGDVREPRGASAKYGRFSSHENGGSANRQSNCERNVVYPEGKTLDKRVTTRFMYLEDLRRGLFGPCGLAKRLTTWCPPERFALVRQLNHSLRRHENPMLEEPRRAPLVPNSPPWGQAWQTRANAKSCLVSGFELLFRLRRGGRLTN